MLVKPSHQLLYSTTSTLLDMSRLALAKSERPLGAASKTPKLRLTMKWDRPPAAKPDALASKQLQYHVGGSYF